MEKVPILIIDDEKNIRLTLSHSLEPLGHSISTAMNGEDGLAQLENGNYGLVFLDLKMPGMDGMQVLQIIRERWPKVRVVIISAHGTVTSAVEAMKYGAVDFLQKPFTPTEIRELAARVLEIEVNNDDRSKNYAELFEETKQFVTSGDYDAATKCVKKVIAADPSRAETYNLFGAVLELRGDKVEAQKFYRAALDIDSTYKPAWNNLERATGWNKTGKVELGAPRKSKEDR